MKPQDMKRTAEVVVEHTLSKLPGDFQVVPATPHTYPFVPWRAYARFRREAEALGFRHVADVDPILLKPDETFLRRTAMSYFLGPDGTESLVHFRLSFRWNLRGLFARWLLGSGASSVHLVSYFGSLQEGVALETARSIASGFEMPPFFIQELLKPGKSLRSVIQRHRERVQAFSAQHPDQQPAALRTFDDVTELSRAIEQRNRAWRRERGWVLREEVARFSRLKGSQLDALYAVVQQEAARRTGTPAA